MNAKVQVKNQARTPAAPVAAHIPQPPVAVPDLDHEAERPLIVAQLEGAARLGHSLRAISVGGYAPPTNIQRQELPEEEEEELQLKRETAALQGQEIPAVEEEEVAHPKPANGVQRQGGGEGCQLEDETARRINRARGGGQPMEDVLQEQMTEALGHDFSGVWVHTDAEADALNRHLSAKAFTIGPDIFFKRGAYAPHSGQGQELIAHELTHVVQQSKGQVNPGSSGMTVRPAGDAFEQEADALAQRAASSPLDQSNQLAQSWANAGRQSSRGDRRKGKAVPPIAPPQSKQGDKVGLCTTPVNSRERSAPGSRALIQRTIEIANKVWTSAEVMRKMFPLMLDAKTQQTIMSLARAENETFRFKDFDALVTFAKSPEGKDKAVKATEASEAKREEEVKQEREEYTAGLNEEIFPVIAVVKEPLVSNVPGQYKWAAQVMSLLPDMGSAEKGATETMQMFLFLHAKAAGLEAKLPRLNDGSRPNAVAALSEALELYYGGPLGEETIRSVTTKNAQERFREGLQAVDKGAQAHQPKDRLKRYIAQNVDNQTKSYDRRVYMVRRGLAPWRTEEKAVLKTWIQEQYMTAPKNQDVNPDKYLVQSVFGCFANYLGSHPSLDQMKEAVKKLNAEVRLPNVTDSLVEEVFREEAKKRIFVEHRPIQVLADFFEGLSH
jgi:hypothetical protein